MPLINVNGLDFFLFDNLLNFRQVRHFTSTRGGGTSKDRYSSLNLGFRTDDPKENVLANRKRLADAIQIPLENFVFAHQVHGNHCEMIRLADRGKGAFGIEDDIKSTDALITNEQEICICVMTADCVPILLFDPENLVISAIHAGWRGTVKNITGQTVKKMSEKFQSKPENIIAGIGPSIGRCHYEVGEDVLEEARVAFGPEHDKVIEKNEQGKWNFDLWESNRLQLVNSGLKSEHIEVPGICTYCQNDRYFSARYHKANSGRLLSGIMLNPANR